MQADTKLASVTAAHTKTKTERAPLDSFPDLPQVTSPTVDTLAAAFYLNRLPQTLRKWACLDNGPIRPLRINGRLAWPTAALKTLLGV